MFFLRLLGPSGWFRTSGLVVPNHALYHLSYTRIFSFLFLPLWSKMWSNGDFRSFCGRDEAPKRQYLQGVAGFWISANGRGCYTLPNQARYQTSLNPGIFDCGLDAGRAVFLGPDGMLRGYSGFPVGKLRFSMISTRLEPSSRSRSS